MDEMVCQGTGIYGSLAHDHMALHMNSLFLLNKGLSLYGDWGGGPQLMNSNTTALAVFLIHSYPCLYTHMFSSLLYKSNLPIIAFAIYIYMLQYCKYHIYDLKLYTYIHI